MCDCSKIALIFQWNNKTEFPKFCVSDLSTVAYKSNITLN